MQLHGNARLCPFQRQLMCTRVRHQGWTIANAAQAAGCSERTVSKWLTRFDAGESMTDRSSSESAVSIASRTTCGSENSSCARRVREVDGLVMAVSFGSGSQRTA